MSNNSGGLRIGCYALSITLAASVGCSSRRIAAVKVFDPSTLSQLADGDFAEGVAGKAPQRWLLGARPSNAYSAMVVAQACHYGKQCAMVQSKVAGSPPDGLAFLHQVVNASAFRGKKFVFQASVRAEVSGTPNVARLLVRVHRENGESSFFDNMGEHPITSKRWARYEIAGLISSDARDIEVGMQLAGVGIAWLDSASLNFSK